MKIARGRIPEFATPVTALRCDGALYDVAKLDAASAGPERSGDFFSRVISARGAGLSELYGRLLTGRRPTEARILETEFFPLPPCEPSRSAYVQLASADHRAEEPQYEHRDARGLVGDGQPVGLRGHVAMASAGLAVVLGEDLEAVTPVEALRAVLGWTLLLQWSLGLEWGAPGPRPAAHLGAALVLAPSLEAVLGKRLVIRHREARLVSDSLDARVFNVAESLAFLSHHVALRAGDVVGLGAARGARIEVVAGERVHVELPGELALEGWANTVPASAAWRVG